ncbi:Chromosome-associated kinesin kif4a [Coemansia erecta]|nr:Chromosome-associated kinesin kif4a [Coemansia sp. RSA 2618]KAJ2822434.1 Chromosome-associated kinesin kif4a [Coemansia erecta]
MFIQRPRAATAPASSANAKATTSCPIKVAIRIRPLCTATPGAPLSLMARTSCIAAESATYISFTPTASNSGNIGLRDKSSGMTRHPVHYAFNAAANQADIFNTAVKPLLAKFAAGHNVAIMAHGQTGSGKTHTMGMTAAPFKGSDTSAGVVPRVLMWLFSQASVPKVTASFVELYNGELHNLANGEVPVASAAAALAVLNSGSRLRHTASTQSNTTSSRSHAVFTVTVSWSGQHGQAKLRFVDLAGSERLEKTQAVGTRRDEGMAINKSLLALGNVFSALARSTLHNYIPYRDDALTMLLRDSVGGNAKTLLLACVAGDAANASETSSTLDFAKRAIRVKRRVSDGMQAGALGTAAEEAQKRMAAEAKVGQLQANISRLQAENRQLKCRIAKFDQKTAQVRTANTETATADMCTADAGTATADMTTADAGTATADMTTADAGTATADMCTADAGTATADMTTADAGTATADMCTADAGTATADMCTADAGTATADMTTADAGTATADMCTADAGTATADMCTADAGTATADMTTADAGTATADMTTADAGTATPGFLTADSWINVAGACTAFSGTDTDNFHTADAGTATAGMRTAGAGTTTTGTSTADAGTDASSIRTADAGTNAMVVRPTDAGTNAAKIRSADAEMDAAGVRSTEASMQAGSVVKQPTKPTKLVRKIKVIDGAQSVDAAEGKAAKCPKPARLIRKCKAADSAHSDVANGKATKYPKPAKLTCNPFKKHMLKFSILSSLYK